MDELCDEGLGDILIFMNGECEICDIVDVFLKCNLCDMEIVLLYVCLLAGE